MKRLILLLPFIMLCAMLLAGDITRYRGIHPDPMVSKITEQAGTNTRVPTRKARLRPTAKTHILVHADTGDPLAPKLMWVLKPEGTEDPPPVPGPDVTLAEYLEMIHERIAKRDWYMAGELSSKALEQAEDMEEGRITANVSPAYIARHRAEFKRLRKAAGEAELQAEARQAFDKLNLALAGIIWDTEAPVAIINETEFREGDVQGSIRISIISDETVKLVHSFKEREFEYTLAI